ncbi:hypothetical protein DUI87_29889 [Hirundo rustica rustica]|uniref:Uncharacterized protein n=1 Tax=Hirundo rustica rustica TaxID=333673 RepID=A0A3M0J054_HIRRU|nr:hypothetical protein DUI87_29889 [Hirundo rustica rustica]
MAAAPAPASASSADAANTVVSGSVEVPPSQASVPLPVESTGRDLAGAVGPGSSGAFYQSLEHTCLLDQEEIWEMEILGYTGYLRNLFILTCNRKGKIHPIGELETMTKMEVIKWMNHGVMTQMQTTRKKDEMLPYSFSLLIGYIFVVESSHGL